MNADFVTLAVTYLPVSSSGCSELGSFETGHWGLRLVVRCFQNTARFKTCLLRAFSMLTVQYFLVNASQAAKYAANGIGIAPKCLRSRFRRTQAALIKIRHWSGSLNHLKACFTFPVGSVEWYFPAHSDLYHKSVFKARTKNNKRQNIHTLSQHCQPSFAGDRDQIKLTCSDLGDRVA